MIEDETLEPGTSKKAKPGPGKKDPILKYIESKRNDEKDLEGRKLCLEERRLALEEKKLEAERTERERYWHNAEERKLQHEKLKNESREKEIFYSLLKDKN